MVQLRVLSFVSSSNWDVNSLEVCNLVESYSKAKRFNVNLSSYMGQAGF